MSDAKRIRDYKKSRQPKPPISALEHRRNCEDIVNNLLMPIVDKLRNSPSDIRPVSETYEELLAQLDGVPRQPFIMQAGKRRLVVCDDEVIELEYQPTIIDSGASEATQNKSDDSEPTQIYSAEEIAILNEIS